MCKARSSLATSFLSGNMPRAKLSHAAISGALCLVLAYFLL
jgi:hypothetical protein